MPVITPQDAPIFDAGHATITGLAAPSRGARDTSAWHLRLAAGDPSPEHSLDREEVFVVLAGRLTARFADREESAEAGGALIVPAGERFSLLAAGAPAEAVCVLPVGALATMGGETFTPPWTR